MGSPANWSVYPPTGIKLQTSEHQSQEHVQFKDLWPQAEIRPCFPVEVGTILFSHIHLVPHSLLYHFQTLLRAQKTPHPDKSLLLASQMCDCSWYVCAATLNRMEREPFMERRNATIHSSSRSIIGVLLSWSLSNVLHKRRKTRGTLLIQSQSSLIFLPFWRGLW